MPYNIDFEKILSEIRSNRKAEYASLDNAIKEFLAKYKARSHVAVATNASKANAVGASVRRASIGSTVQETVRKNTSEEINIPEESIKKLLNIMDNRYVHIKDYEQIYDKTLLEKLFRQKTFETNKIKNICIKIRCDPNKIINTLEHPEQASQEDAKLALALLYADFDIEKLQQMLDETKEYIEKNKQKIRNKPNNMHRTNQTMHRTRFYPISTPRNTHEKPHTTIQPNMPQQMGQIL